MKGIEEQIRQAMEEGKFEDLPGKGKPLNLNENPLVDPEWRMAHHLLHSNGFTLTWIEKRKEIEEVHEKARGALARSWGWRQAALERGLPANLVEAEWGRAVEAFREQIAAINKRIFNFNLEVPSDQFQRRILNAELEIQAVCERTPASDSE